jgi:hypothetical protein
MRNTKYKRLKTKWVKIGGEKSMLKRVNKKIVYALDCGVVSVTVDYNEIDMITIKADNNWLELDYDEMVAIHAIFDELIKSSKGGK